MENKYVYLKESDNEVLKNLRERLKRIETICDSISDQYPIDILKEIGRLEELIIQEEYRVRLINGEE